MSKPLPWITMPKTRRSAEMIVRGIEQRIEYERDQNEFTRRHSLGKKNHVDLGVPYLDDELTFWASLRDHIEALGDTLP